MAKDLPLPLLARVVRAAQQAVDQTLPQLRYRYRATSARSNAGQYLLRGENKESRPRRRGAAVDHIADRAADDQPDRDGEEAGSRPRLSQYISTRR